MIRIATFNVENLFSRPKALNTANWSLGKPILKAYSQVSEILSKAEYSDDDKKQIKELFVKLDIYYINNRNAIRRRRTQVPKWAWFRKNQGKFDTEPSDDSKDVDIVANGRKDWVGWVELAKESVNEISINMTAKVIMDIDADIIGIIEAEDRPTLCRFNEDKLGRMYGHVMLIDGNDERGIDVGIMTRENTEIKSIRSNVDAVDQYGLIFSRDCPQYSVHTPDNGELHILVNHFKSQSGGGDNKRRRQAAEVRKIADFLVNQGKKVVVLGDFNEGPSDEASPPENLATLFDTEGQLVDCYSLPDFDIGKRPGTYGSCGIRNRFDYILISKNLSGKYRGGTVFRNGLWGDRKTRPTEWKTYDEITESSEQASDHAAVYIDLDI